MTCDPECTHWLVLCLLAFLSGMALTFTAVAVAICREWRRTLDEDDA